MALARHGLWLGVLAVGCTGVGLLASGHAQQQTQQQVPDAPKPQTLPSLNTITPAGPALPPAPAATTAGTMPEDDGKAAPSALPSSPAQTASDGVDNGGAPIIASNGDAAQQTARLSVNVTFVQIPFTVKDSHHAPVPGITARDVRIFENGVRQHLSFFADSSEIFPLSVAFVIDQSVTFDTMEKINNSLEALQGAFTKYDEVAVFTYSSSVKPQDNGQFTAAPSARLTAILDNSKSKGRDPVMPLGGPLSQTTIKNNQQVDPNTAAQGYRNGGGFEKPEKEFHALNDAILAAATAVSKAERGRRRIVYVISDGKESGSKAREKDVIKYLQTNRIEVYATLVGDTAIPGLGFIDRIHLPYTMRDNALPRYVAETGGQMDYEFRQGGIEKSYARIAGDARTQYLAGYYTKESPYSEKFRKYEVQVMRPGLEIIAPPGYFPVPPPMTAPRPMNASTPAAAPSPQTDKQ